MTMKQIAVRSASGSADIIDPAIRSGAVHVARNRHARLPGGLGQAIVAMVLVCGVVCAADWGGNPYWVHTVHMVGILLTVSLFQNFLLVDAGQTSFGQGAVFGASAYAATTLAALHGVPYPIAALAGILAAGLFGLLFALPALRVQGYYLGFMTFSVALVFPELIAAFPQYTDGINGIPLPFPTLNGQLVLGVSLLSWMVMGVSCGAILLLVWLRHSRFGRSLRVAAFSNEAAQSLGISPGLMRCAAFLLASLGTGVAGTLYAPVVQFVGPTAFNVELSMLFFFAVIVGGRGQLLGPVLGLAVLYLLPNILLADVVNYRLLIYGAIALVVMLLFPDGLVGTAASWQQRRRLGRAAALDLNLDRIIAPIRAITGRAASSTVPAVQVQGGGKRFGRVAALDNVDFEVRAGEIHGLIGANGSGKTSLLNVLSGFSQLDSGSFRVWGRDTRRMTPHRIADLGIGRTFQTPRMFTALSTWENLQIGLDARTRDAPPVQAGPLDDLRAALEDHAVHLIPHGQRRLIEVLRIALKDANLLLLDEPAAGLSTREREEFATLLRQLRDEFGKTIILVEHDLDLVLGLADRITVLEAGKVIGRGTPEEVSSNAALSSLFVATFHA